MQGQKAQIDTDCVILHHTLIIMDSVARFFALYFTTLFSLNTWSAAMNSPYRLPSVSSDDAHRERRLGQRDFGEGANIGRRLDPGGPDSRHGGFGSGNRAVDIPTCGSCAAPKIS